MTEYTQPADGVLAFAFGLTPDGAPGATNEALAALLTESALALDGLQGAIRVVQWEIADALLRNHGETLRPAQVAWPPAFEIGAFRRPDLIATALLGARERDDTPAGLLYQRLDARAWQDLDQLGTVRSSRLSATLMVAFNKVLDQADFCAAYLDAVDAADRPALAPLEKGVLGVEERRVPATSQALPPGQARRVNRLIIESMFGDALGTSSYLSTSGICRWTLMTNPTINRWRLYAHPAHQPRCCEALMRVGRLVGRELEITLGDCASADFDMGSAQTWTRDAPTFAAYEAEVAARRRCR